MLPNLKPLITEGGLGLIQAKRKKLRKGISASVKVEEGKVFILLCRMVKCGK